MEAADKNKETWKCPTCGDWHLMGLGQCDVCRASRPVPMDPMALKANMDPWYNLKRIDCSGEFYGRRREVEQVYAGLTAPRAQSVSIVGDRKMGKSSLLHYLADPFTIEKYSGKDSPPLFFVQVDASGILSIDGFFNAVVAGLGRIPDAQGFVEATDAGDLLLPEILDRMQAAGARLIFLIDEFEEMVRGLPEDESNGWKQHLDEETFYFLNHRTQQYDTAYVTVTERGIAPALAQSRFPAIREEAHHFAEISKQVRVATLDRDSIDALITEPAWRVGLLDQFLGHKEDILALTGGFPFLVQLACSHLFKEILLADAQRACIDFSKVQRRFAWDAEAAFADIVRGSESPEMHVYEDVANSRQPSDPAAASALEERGHLERQEGELRIFSRLFEQYLKDNGYIHIRRPHVPPPKKPRDPAIASAKDGPQSLRELMASELVDEGLCLKIAIAITQEAQKRLRETEKPYKNINPDTILVDESKKTIAWLTKPGSAPTGKPGGTRRDFRAPEVIDEEEAGIKADIYSLGESLWEALKSNPGADGRAEQLRINNDFYMVLLKMRNESPEDRHKSALWLLADLRAIQEGRLPPSIYPLGVNAAES